MDPFLPPGHVLSAWWERGRSLQPRLTMWHRGDGFDVTIEPDASFLVEVSKQRTCIGDWRRSSYRECPTRAAVDGAFGQCPRCGDAELEQCVFTPAEGCGHAMCHAPHAVYLAFFGPHAKVGMTRGGRERARVLEQGADAYVVLARPPSRFEARRLEQAVSERLHVPEWLMPKQTMAAWAMEDPLGKAGDVLETYLPELEAMGLRPGPLVPLSGFPAPSPLPSVPRVRLTHGVHRGRILGCRGKYLFYESPKGKLTAMRWMDLPARWSRLPGTLE